MTYPGELAEALHRDAGIRGGALTFHDSEITLDEVIDACERTDDLRSVTRTFPFVHPAYIRRVRHTWVGLAARTDSLREARRRLHAQADWALISQVIARHIDEGGHLLAGLPLMTEGQTLVREALGDDWSYAGERECEPDPTARTSGGPVTARSGSAPHRTLAEAAGRLRDAAGSLRPSSPVESALARELARRVDELAAEVDPHG